MLDLVLGLVLGVSCGVLAGLLPGMHPNTLFFALLGFLMTGGLSTHALLAFVVSLAVTDLMVNFIPNVFLSVPDAELVLNVLPGHRLVLQGRGYDALFISIVGALGTLFLTTLLFPAILQLIPILHEFVYPFIHWLLLATIAWMVVLERGLRQKLACLGIYALSGLWGVLTLNSSLIRSEQAIFPALLGMFGMSNLLMSARGMTSIPEQSLSRRVELGFLWRMLGIGLVAGLLTGILPGIGQAQAGVMVSTLGGVTSREFLGVLAGIAMSNLIFSMISLYSFGKVRSGVAAAIQEVARFGFGELLLTLAISLVSGSIAAMLTWFMGKKLLDRLQGIDYALLSRLVMILMVGMVCALTGFVGLFVLLISTFIGLLPILLGTKRTACMGYLMVVTVLYFLGLSGAMTSFLIG
jgi:putative membrane protein